MIADLIFVLISVVFLLLFAFLSVINFVLPDSITTAISYFVSKLHYLEIVFPISVLMTALGVYLTFIFYYYLYKLFVFFLSWLPFIKGNKGQPNIKVIKNK